MVNYTQETKIYLKQSGGPTSDTSLNPTNKHKYSICFSLEGPTPRALF